jgi:hypothetical protein
MLKAQNSQPPQAFLINVAPAVDPLSVKLVAAVVRMCGPSSCDPYIVPGPLISSRASSRLVT